MMYNARINREFHAASWHEPIIFQLGSEGERGITIPKTPASIVEKVGGVTQALPESVRRKNPPRLPEMAQPQVVRHYMRLSQMCLGNDLNIDLGQGTCTMKYNPQIDEELARSPKVTDLHPLQPEESVQGMLEMLHRAEKLFCAISGMDRFSFHPSGGTAGIFLNACLIRAYHESRGEAEQRNEIITTIFSHPADAATPSVAGFKVVTLYPDENGYPSVEALKAVLSERTAGLMLTNPEDTGIYNPNIKEFVDLVHAAGGLCAYDQANTNGILGVARAKEAGFDMCHFNLHKTFGAPHGGSGPACGVVGVRDELAKFLPAPLVAFDGEKYHLDYDRPESIGKIKGFMGNANIVLKSYAWIMSLGADGLLQAGHTATMNNNYLLSLLSKIDGVSIPYIGGKHRVEQVRYSMQKLYEETGVTTDDIARRLLDYGVTDWYSSHHPWLVPQPFTLEPSETYSKRDLDEYATIVETVFNEARTNPELVKTAPHNSTMKQCDDSVVQDRNRWAFTWKMYEKRVLKQR